MKKFSVIDEQIFRVYKPFEYKRCQSCGYEDFPRTAFGKRLLAWRGRLQK